MQINVTEDLNANLQTRGGVCAPRLAAHCIEESAMRTAAKILLVAAAVTLAGIPAVAQPQAPQAQSDTGYGPRGFGPGMMGGFGPGMMMGPGRMGGRFGRSGFCDPRGAGFAGWRVAQIERTLRLTDAQRTAFEALRTASAKAEETMAANCPREFPRDASKRMALMEQRMETMLAAIKTVRPAFDAFYATLDTEQKTQLDNFGPGGWHRWRFGGR
jgi:hypothetical protein